MSANLENKLERVIKILDDLADEASRGIPIIVEGRRDVEALVGLNIKGKIIAVKTLKRNVLSVLNEIEKLGKDEVILLLDFDKRGRELMRHLTAWFEKTKIKANAVFWREIFGLLRRDIKDIEGLPTYIETLKRKLEKDLE